MSNVRRRKREKLSQVQRLGSILNPAKVSRVGQTTFSLFSAKLCAAESELHRITTAIGSARIGTSGRCRAGLGSSTPTAANTSSICRTKSVSYWAQFGHTAACENNSNTQGGAPFWFRQCLGRQGKSSGSTSAA